ncbi:DUF2683 family protein [Pedobacter sp.]
MRKRETLIIHPKNKVQLAAIKAFVKALKIEFTTIGNEIELYFN